MQLKDRIERRLAAKGLKRAEASRMAGLNATYVRDLIEARVKNPRAEHLAKLADVLGTTLEWLAEERGPEERSPAAEHRAKVLQIWEHIAPEDQEHAIRLLQGFAQPQSPHRRKRD